MTVEFLSDISVHNFKLFWDWCALSMIRTETENTYAEIKKILYVFKSSLENSSKIKNKMYIMHWKNNLNKNKI